MSAIIWLHDFTPSGAVFVRPGEKSARLPRSPERLYRAVRHFKDGRATGCEVFVVEGANIEPLDPRHDILRRSTGFEWSFVGAGSGQTALAILADALGDDGRALALHVDFCRTYIARCDRAGFEITANTVCGMAEAIEAQRARLA